MPAVTLRSIVAATILAGLCAAAAAAQDEEGEAQLLSLSSRTFSFERIGNFTSLRCASDDQGPDCESFERLDVSPQIDWERLLERARQAAPRTKVRTEVSTAAIVTDFAVDRYGGPWRVALSAGAGKDTPEFLQPFACRITADFPGYRVALKGGKVSGVEVLRDRTQWVGACQSLGLDESGKKKKKKRGLGSLFE